LALNLLWMKRWMYLFFIDNNGTHGTPGLEDDEASGHSDLRVVSSTGRQQRTLGDIFDKQEAGSPLLSIDPEICNGRQIYFYRQLSISTATILIVRRTWWNLLNNIHKIQWMND
jgi:hypothetical protein